MVTFIILKLWEVKLGSPEALCFLLMHWEAGVLEELEEWKDTVIDLRIVKNIKTLFKDRY